METIPRAMRQIRGVARSMAGGLSVPQFRTLGFLERHPGSSLMDVADHLGISQPGASTLVDRLVTSGLVARDIDAAERRRITLVLTPDGRARVASATITVHAWWVRQLGELSPRELDILIVGLGLLGRALDHGAADEAPERQA